MFLATRFQFALSNLMKFSNNGFLKKGLEIADSVQIQIANIKKSWLHMYYVYTYVILFQISGIKKDTVA